MPFGSGNVWLVWRRVTLMRAVWVSDGDKLCMGLGGDRRQGAHTTLGSFAVKEGEKLGGSWKGKQAGEKGFLFCFVFSAGTLCEWSCSEGNRCRRGRHTATVTVTWLDGCFSSPSERWPGHCLRGWGWGSGREALGQRRKGEMALWGSGRENGPESVA